jgi:hypothetical protein
MMAKARKGKVPKKVAGLRVPKSLRKSKTLDTLLGSALGREILAGALVAAAGAAASYLMKHRPTADQVADAGEAVADAGTQAAVISKDLTMAAAGALAELVTAAVDRFRPASPAPARKKRKKAAAARASDVVVLDKPRRGRTKSPRPASHH